MYSPCGGTVIALLLCWHCIVIIAVASTLCWHALVLLWSGWGGRARVVIIIAVVVAIALTLHWHHCLHHHALVSSQSGWEGRVKVLQFYSWVALFSLSLLFVLCLLSRDPFVTLIIIISLSWDPSHSPYAPFNPYTVPCITTRQRVLFAYLFLVMDDYSFSRFSHICCIFLLLILLSITFHDLPFLLSGTFYLVLSCSFAYSADLLSSI